jgi:hypothetical protein
VRDRLYRFVFAVAIAALMSLVTWLFVGETAPASLRACPHLSELCGWLNAVPIFVSVVLSGRLDHIPPWELWTPIVCWWFAVGWLIDWLVSQARNPR